MSLSTFYRSTAAAVIISVLSMSAEAGSDITPINNNLPVLIPETLGNTEQVYAYKAPKDAQAIRFRLSGASDLTLHVRQGKTPTATEFDCHTTTNNGLADCDVTNSGETIYVSVRSGEMPVSGAVLLSSLAPKTLNNIDLASE